jgi:hypothetical protein
MGLATVIEDADPMTAEAPVPPVYDHVVERLAQRLADGDENADMPEYRKRAAKLLAEAQNPTPVPLPAQIEKVKREIRYAQVDGAQRAERLWSAVLESLQRLAEKEDAK